MDGLGTFQIFWNSVGCQVFVTSIFWSLVRIDAYRYMVEKTPSHSLYQNDMGGFFTLENMSQVVEIYMGFPGDLDDSRVQCRCAIKFYEDLGFMPQPVCHQAPGSRCHCLVASSVDFFPWLGHGTMGPTCSHGCPKNHLKMVQKSTFLKVNWKEG